MEASSSSNAFAFAAAMRSNWEMIPPCETDWVRTETDVTTVTETHLSVKVKLYTDVPAWIQNEGKQRGDII